MLDKQKIIKRMDEIYQIPKQRASDFVGIAYTLNEMMSEFNELYKEISHGDKFDAELGEAK